MVWSEQEGSPARSAAPSAGLFDLDGSWSHRVQPSNLDLNSFGPPRGRRQAGCDVDAAKNNRRSSGHMAIRGHTPASGRKISRCRIRDQGEDHPIIGIDGTIGIHGLALELERIGLL